MATTRLSNNPHVSTPAITATYQTTTAPTGSTPRFVSPFHGRVRTYITYAGSVTGANLQLWIYDKTLDKWFAGTSTDAEAPLTPSDSADARDWDIGRGVEFAVQVASISPGTSGNTIAVSVSGVEG